MKIRRKYDGTTRPNILYFDDFIQDIQYFDDISLKRTIHFFTRNRYTGNYLASSLFLADNNDNSVLYFQKKTIIGFMMISGYFNEFWEFFNGILRVYNNSYDEPTFDDIPNKWTTTFPKSKTYGDIYNDVKNFVDENINITDIARIYKEYFCLNYRTMKTKDITGIKCEDKKPIIEQKIYEELIIKITYIIYYCLQENDKMQYILHHYILCFYKSDRSTVYNISLELKEKKYPKSLITLYNKFNNIDVSEVFVTLRYLYQYNYIKKGKHFTTCGETTLLNILNYCLINKDGTFNTKKILNEDVINFYEGKTMSQIAEKNGIRIMSEWLDIVSNLSFSEIYNITGDIHNNVKNVAYVLNKIVYDEDSFVDSPNKFIVDTIKYISNNPIDIKIEISRKDSVSLNIDNKYSLFFKPGHGEMNPMVNDKIKKKIKTIDLENMIDESNDFDIVYSFYKKILTMRDYDDHKLDYDEAISYIAITYLIEHIDLRIIQLLLLEITKLSITYENLEELDDPKNYKTISFFLKTIVNTKVVKIDSSKDTFKISNFIIKNLPENVTSFKIAIHEMSDNLFKLEPLEKLKLESLCISKTNMPYINIPTLTTLELEDIKDIDFIDKYKNLINLKLDVPEYFNMKSLSNLVNLKKIWLRTTYQNAFDCKIIEKCTELEDLTLSNFSHINSVFENIDALSNHTKLKRISLIRFDLSSEDLEVIFNELNIDNIYFSESCKMKQNTLLILENKNINEQTIEQLETHKIKYIFVDEKFTILLSYNSKILKFIVNYDTEMKVIFDIFTNKYGTGYEFFFNDKKVKETDIFFDLGKYNTKEIKITVRKEGKMSSKSSSRRTSSSNSSSRRTSSSKSSSRNR